MVYNDLNMLRHACEDRRMRGSAGQPRRLTFLGLLGLALLSFEEFTSTGLSYLSRLGCEPCILSPAHSPISEFRWRRPSSGDKRQDSLCGFKQTRLMGTTTRNARALLQCKCCAVRSATRSPRHPHKSTGR